MEFRKAGASDAPSIARAEEEIFSDPWTLRDVSDILVTEGGMCYVALDGGRVIGYVLGRIIPPEGELYRVAVLPSYRRRGIGYRLLDFAVKSSKSRGLEILFLEVRRQNTAAKALYRAYGFRDVSVRKNYYRDPPDDAIVMVRAHPDDLRT